MSKYVKGLTPFLALMLLVFMGRDIHAGDFYVIPVKTAVSPDIEARITALESQVASLQALQHAKAFGRINQYDVGTQYTQGVTSVVWSATYDRYELTLTDAYYSIDDAATVTINGDAGSCPAGAVGRVSSVSGKLLVYIVNSSGAKIQCSFTFVAFVN